MSIFRALSKYFSGKLDRTHMCRKMGQLNKNRSQHRQQRVVYMPDFIQVILERRVHDVSPVQGDREVMTAFPVSPGRKDVAACRVRRAELALRVKMVFLVHPAGPANRYVVLYCHYVNTAFSPRGFVCFFGHFILQRDYTKIMDDCLDQELIPYRY